MVLPKALLIIYPKNDKQKSNKICSRSTKYVSLKISQNSQENTRTEVSF